MVWNRNVDRPKWRWTAEGRLRHELDSGNAEWHSRSRAPHAVNPEKVDASRVALTCCPQRSAVGLEVKRRLGAGLSSIGRDANRLGTLDVVKEVMFLNAGPSIGQLLNVGEVGAVLLAGEQLNLYLSQQSCGRWLKLKFSFPPHSQGGLCWAQVPRTTKVKMACAGKGSDRPINMACAGHKDLLWAKWRTCGACEMGRHSGAPPSVLRAG